MASLLIGDVGSTSGKWVFSDPGGQSTVFNTPGYNPATHREEAFLQLADSLNWAVSSSTRIFYYGSGVINDTVMRKLRVSLERLWPGCEIEIADDLTGSGRGLCGKHPGIIAILGTGSICGHFDGRSVVERSASLGYPLGDEGGGWRIGAQLLRSYYYGLMPNELSTAFATEAPANREEFVKQLNTAVTPNRYLASFATFAGVRQEHPWVAKMVEDCFKEFIEAHVIPLTRERATVHFTGSVATGFSGILEKTLSGYGLKTGVVVSSPLDGLLKYHLDEP